MAKRHFLVTLDSTSPQPPNEGLEYATAKLIEKNLERLVDNRLVAVCVQYLGATIGD